MPKKPLARDLREFCDQVYPEDGITFDDYKKMYRHSINGNDYRQLKLCREIYNELDLAIFAERSDPMWEKCFLTAVEPINGSKSLLLNWQVSAQTEEELTQCQNFLLSQKSWLKIQGARAIHRKKMPDFRFLIIPYKEESQ